MKITNLLNNVSSVELAKNEIYQVSTTVFDGITNFSSLIYLTGGIVSLLIWAFKYKKNKNTKVAIHKVFQYFLGFLFIQLYPQIFSLLNNIKF